MLKPPALRSGDRIGVIAPASPFDRDEFERGLRELRTLGFEPVFDETVFARDQGYLAGDARLRTEAFRRAWADPSVAGVIAVRGGYGSVQLLPGLDREEIRATPKAFIGYSDLTSLLTHLSCGCGLVCFHGPMLDRRLGRGADGYDRDSFLGCLTRPVPYGQLAEGLDVIAAGEAAGPVFGGNLTQLTASLGTAYSFAPDPGYVLFLEDVDERPYRLDRMLTQLRLARVLERAVAIVVGQMPGCDEPNGTPSARATLGHLLQAFPGPVVYGLPCGHTAGPALTLPLGISVRVVAGPTGRVVLEEAAVA